MLAHGIFFVLSLAGITSAGNTTCLNSSMDWFTRSVGESPCRVYERLRATCSPGFQLGNMPNTAPGDTCGDQVSACCCNTVSFALSMLCMSCQWGIGSGVNQDFGFDAPPGTYAKYLGNCGPIVNQTLPDNVQMAVCRQNIKIPSYVYNPEWHTDGSWFFYYTRQTAELQINSGQNETGKCAALLQASASTASVVSSTQSLILSSQTSTSSTSKASSPPVGAIVGGVLGGLALLVGGALAGYFFSRRRAKRNMVDLVEENDKLGTVYTPYQSAPAPAPTPAPAQFPAPTTYGPGSSGWTYTDASSSSGGYAASSALEPAPTLAPAPVPRHQKGGMVPGTHIAGSPADVGPSQPLFHHRNSSDGSQVDTGASVTTELPPSYEPRR